MNWRWFGQVDYLEMLAWQEARRDAVISQRLPDVLALVEHPRVITAGRRGGGDLSRIPPDLPVVHTGRGGLATWHGPGQIVGYPIVDLNRAGLRVRDCVRLIEEGLIGWVRDQGVAAERDPANPGVWVEGRKLGSVGIHVKRGVVMHGFALNVNCDLTDFSSFTPCGLPDVKMTSMREHGFRHSMQDVVSAIGCAMSDSLTADGPLIKRLTFPEGA